MKIVVLDGYTLNPGDLSWDGLKELGEVKIYDRTSNDEILDRIKEADVVLTNKVPLRKKHIDLCNNLKYIGVLATGYNIIDVKAARERNIPVSNVPVYGTKSVAQMAFALLLEISNHVGAHYQSVHDGNWSNSKDWSYWNYPLIELAGKSLGIIGLGRIGMNVAKIASGFDMQVIAYNHNTEKSEHEYGKYVSFDELLLKSDIISLHCPLVPSTEGIINKDTINKMKDRVIIINNSRGQLIVEEDLADALNSGKVYAAGLDVVSSEPIKEDNPLLDAKNCIITPHISWAPKESRTRLMDVAVKNLESFIDGDPTNIVN